MLPTDMEIRTVSADPRRFKRVYPMAAEVTEYASSHDGRLPEFVFELSEFKWEQLSRTMRELDQMAWLRRLAA